MKVYVQRPSKNLFISISFSRCYFNYLTAVYLQNQDTIWLMFKQYCMKRVEIRQNTNVSFIDIGIVISVNRIISYHYTSHLLLVPKWLDTHEGHK